MKSLNRKSQTTGPKRPVKVVQFGEGNFLRAFLGYAFHKLNTGLDFGAGIAVVQPIDCGMIESLNNQDGLYTLFSKGLKGGKEIQEELLIDCIVKGVDPYSDFNAYKTLAMEAELEFVVSNTTEAGIVFEDTDTPTMAPPKSFPAKLTVLLFERFKYFGGAMDKGLVILPCELINSNGDNLKSIVHQYINLWGLGNDFQKWIDGANTFCNTLVDRIVPGYPKDDMEYYDQRLGYKDGLIVVSEIFFLWVIEGDEKLKERLPFHKVGLDVKIVSDLQPYRTRKVRILNGSHTSMVPISLMYGNETVKESVDDRFIGAFISNTIFEEIIPTLDMDRTELEEFAHAVLDRFRNPFIKHYLSSIALNSISKFKVRVLPSLLYYHGKYDALPVHLVFSFACLVRLYKGEWKGNRVPLQDEKDIIDSFQEVWQQDDLMSIAHKILRNERFWGQDLTKIYGLQESLFLALRSLEELGVEKGFIQFSNLMK
jgi:tagaturonate reductase